jgi:hypothetical protein
MCDELVQLKLEFVGASLAHLNAEYLLRAAKSSEPGYDKCKQRALVADAEFFRARSLAINHRLQHGCSTEPTE